MWVLTTVEIGVGFDKISVGVDNGGDRCGGGRWVVRLAWRDQWVVRSSYGDCGVVISVGVNGFFFFFGFAGICDWHCGGCGVVIGVMGFFFFSVLPIWVDINDGGVWKKVKSKVMEEFGRYTHVEEKIGKKQKWKKYILL